MNPTKTDCLMFQTTTGQQILCSAEWVSLELIGDGVVQINPEMVRHASAAVLHYFKHEMNRETVSVGEFAAALEKALRGMGLGVVTETRPESLLVLESDLVELMKSAGENGELFFFPHLRQELKRHLGASPQIVRFNGLRACAKQLAGADRWSRRCEDMSDRLVDYLRTCWVSETGSQTATLVVL